jgi:hypothetical protein
MDGDDIMHPERLARQVAFIEQHPEVDVIDSAAYLIDRSTHIFGVFAKPIGEPEPAAVLLARSFLAHPAVLARVAWFQQNQYSESPEFERCQDLELWIRSLLAGRLRAARVREPLLFYRVGVSDFPRYRMMTEATRCIARRYGPQVLGSPRTAMLIGRLWADQIVHQFASGLGCEEVLFRIIRKRRLRHLAEDESDRAQRALHEAIATPIPGWIDGHR